MGWQVQNNVGKRGYQPHHQNRKTDYDLNGERLEKGEVQQDLRVLVHQSVAGNI